MYVIPGLTYATSGTLVPLTFKAQWKNLEAVQNIGLRTIRGCPFYVRNDVNRSSAGLNTIQGTILNQASAMFHKNSISRFPHIRSIGHKPVEHRRRTLKTRPLLWVSTNNF